MLLKDKSRCCLPARRIISDGNRSRLRAGSANVIVHSRHGEDARKLRERRILGCRQGELYYQYNSAA